MMAGIAVTAADPSGLWGLLKESFASSSELVKAKMDPGANPLIKAVVSDFGTAEGRSTAREGLNEQAQRPQTSRDHSQVHRDAAASRRGGGREGGRRCCRLQGMAAPDQPTRRRGSARRGASWYWRRTGKRCREGDADTDIERAQVGGVIRPRASAPHARTSRPGTSWKRMLRIKLGAVSATKARTAVCVMLRSDPSGGAMKGDNADEFHPFTWRAWCARCIE